MEELIKARRDFIITSLKTLGFIIITLFLFILAIIGRPGYNWIWSLCLVVISVCAIKWWYWPDLQEKSQEFLRLAKEKGLDIGKDKNKDDKEK